MNVVPGFALWIANRDAAANTETGTPTAADGTVELVWNNDGAIALNTFKIFLAADAEPVDEFFGFPMPRGRPFMKATGDNEIEVEISSARAGVQCWMYGNEYGSGFCNVQQLTNYEYGRLAQFREMNFMVCKVGLTAGTAVSGDVILVPFTMVEGASTG